MFVCSGTGNPDSLPKRKFNLVPPSEITERVRNLNNDGTRDADEYFAEGWDSGPSTLPKGQLADHLRAKGITDEWFLNYRRDAWREELIQLENEFWEAARTTAEKAIRSGELLEKMKATFKHAAGWTEYKKSLPFSPATVDNWRNAYKNRHLAKFLTVRNLRLTDLYRAGKAGDEGDGTEDTAGYTDSPQLRIVGDDDETDEMDGAGEAAGEGEGRPETSKKTDTVDDETETAETEVTPERGDNLADIREIKLRFNKADVEEFNRQIQFLKKAGAGDNSTDIVAQLVQQEAERLGYDVPETILEPERGEDGLIIADNQRTRAFGAKQDTIDYLIRCRLMNIGKDNPHRAEAFNGIIRWLVIQRERANG